MGAPIIMLSQNAGEEMKITKITLCKACRSSGHKDSKICWYCGSKSLVESEFYGEPIVKPSNKKHYPNTDNQAYKNNGK